ncbi:MAG: RDD family protein, partial [Deltaproteobacteria bacterium]|nr:RDD family protein [Deltaproteobacteria bacterium]
KKPILLTELREDVPPGLERIVARCLSKEPEGRYADYKALSSSLLPFSSKEPEPASMKARSPAGWIDYMIAFLIPYVILMFTVGGEELLIRPLVDRTLYSAKYYLALLIIGFLYFSITEGIWGAGIGKWLKGLRVVRANGRPPGIGRALIRIVIPIFCVEGLRIPISMTFITDADWTGLQTILFVLLFNVCGWVPVLLVLKARRENGYATVWDRISGTRVVVKPKGTVRPSIETIAQPEIPAEGADSLGPYKIIKEIVPGHWIVATDPVLHRQIWLLRRNSLELSPARRNLSRYTRLRWLQGVETDEATWDAFEAIQGVPYSSLLEGGKRVPWGKLRHWLHDLALELWEATGDLTLPAELSLDFVWITTQGIAVLLDEPWPDVNTPAKSISIEDLAGQQRFLNAIAACVESTSLPLHAKPVLQNLKDEKFEKLSFLTGILRGILDKPSEVNRGIRVGSIFMMPVFVWILAFVGRYAGGKDPAVNDLGGIVLILTMVVLGASALIHLLELPFRSTAGHSIFRLAVVNAKGERASISNLFVRWAIIWLPLLLPMSIAALLIKRVGNTAAIISGLVWLLLWMGAAVYAVIHPNRGLHDRLAGTWIVPQ